MAIYCSRHLWVPQPLCLGLHFYAMLLDLVYHWYTPSPRGARVADGQARRLSLVPCMADVNEKICVLLYQASETACSPHLSTTIHNQKQQLPRSSHGGKLCPQVSAPLQLPSEIKALQRLLQGEKSSSRNLRILPSSLGFTHHPSDLPIIPQSGGHEASFVPGKGI